MLWSRCGDSLTSLHIDQPIQLSIIAALKGLDNLYLHMSNAVESACILVASLSNLH